MSYRFLLNRSWLPVINTQAMADRIGVAERPAACPESRIPPVLRNHPIFRPEIARNHSSHAPIRVCHIGKYYPPAHGGIESHVRTLALAQAAIGMQVQVVCVNHLAGATRAESDGPVRVIRVARLASAAKLDICPELTSVLRSVSADVFHLHVPNPTAILAILMARIGTPMVVTYHSDHIGQAMRSLLLRPLEHQLYRRVDALLATSPTYAAGSDLLRRYADRVEVLPHGIDTRPFRNPSPSDLRTAQSLRAAHLGPIWVACGRLIRYKGLEHAIRALPLTRGTLIIVGEGPDRSRLEAEAATSQVADRVVFAGSVAAVAPYFLAAHALWFPSNARSEAFGLVQVEAMAAGCPVINTSIPNSGVSWVSRHGETGLTVPVNDPTAIAAAADRLLDEPGLRDRLGHAARERALKEFDHHVMAERSRIICLRAFARATGARKSASA